ncbi:MAG TPA: helicase HerA-like domain-containing protein, partial [Fimbriimonadaceae bacterium]|nr:helicase HerA-like domain-containing protein [Fimbriimonadaceae bacterium]
MSLEDRIVVGVGDTPVPLLLKYANRHGLITGATGTGKTVTLQVLAEGFSRNGVPVFMADVKGDLTGLVQKGGGNPKLDARAEQLGMAPLPQESFPAVFWDVFGENGHPIRGTVSDMGPLLLSRLLNLTDAQEGVLNLTFKLADDQGLLMLDLKDLRSMLAFVGENAKELRNNYGNVSSATVGAIQRNLLVLEQQGGDRFFGEPALELPDLMRTAADGRGFINILAADRLMENPRTYATFLLWLLAELFEELPEAGDIAKPKLVFFFDEAHLLFNDAPKGLVDKVEQVVRLIRSKGVGVYFVTQNPLDIPDSVLGQLGNRVQHALRAFTPRDQKAVRSAGDTFRPNPKFNAAEVIPQLGIGEALISVLDEKGTPTVVERALVVPPHSRVGPAEAPVRAQAAGMSPVGGKYDTTSDRYSAYEALQQRAQQAVQEAEQAERQAEIEKEQRTVAQHRRYEPPAYEPPRPRTTTRTSQPRSSGGRSRQSDSVMEAMAKSA